MNDSSDILHEEQIHTTKYVETHSTSMPVSWSSDCNASDHVCRKAFEPEYVARRGDGVAPAKEDSVKIKPRFLEFILFSQ